MVPLASASIAGKQLRTARGEPVVQLAVGFIRAEQRALLDEDVARVHAGIHRDDRHARLLCAVANRRLQRRRTAIARQEARMNVERDPARGDIENRLRDDPAVRRDDEHIGRERGEIRRERAQFQRLEDRQAVLERERFDGRRR
jgi:hypothetical protein